MMVLKYACFLVLKNVVKIFISLLNINMCNIFSWFFKKKREHDLIQSESKREIRIAWERAGYTEDEVAKLFNQEYSKRSKFS